MSSSLPRRAGELLAALFGREGAVRWRRLLAFVVTFPTLTWLITQGWGQDSWPLVSLAAVFIGGEVVERGARMLSTGRRRRPLGKGLAGDVYTPPSQRGTDA